MTKIQQPKRPVVSQPRPKPILSKPDTSAAAALAALSKDNTKAGSISGKEMADAILAATKDPDNQAAGKEYDAIKKWAGKNGRLLSPEAKKVYEVYSKECQNARRAGQTGIDFRTYNKMTRDMQAASKPGYKDAGAAQQLNELASGNTKPGSISGKEMAEAIINGTKDLDGQAAGKEFADVAKFVKENDKLLSPEAKKVFSIYQQQAKAAQAKGQTGIPQDAFNRMARDMMRAGAPGYQDKGAAATLNELAAGNPKPGSISGKEMTEAIIKGTADLDGQAAGKEFADISKFVKENGQLLSPEAKQAFEVYQKYAKAAQGKGNSGIDLRDFMKMQVEMQNVSGPKFADQSASAALNTLAAGNKEPGSISGKELTEAIINGTRDLDGQAAGKEFADVAKFVRENEQLLSPEAKKAFAVYQKYANQAQMFGQSGISQFNFARMQGEMNQVAGPNYGDQSAGTALNGLAKDNKTPGSISAQEMMNAIINGTADLDGQAAGKEFADVAKFVKENKQLLSPGAQKIFETYEKHAKAAQAKGQSGIPLNDFWRMQQEMKTIATPVIPNPGPVNQLPALAQANPTPGAISAQEAAGTIANHLADLQALFGNLAALGMGNPDTAPAAQELLQLGGFVVAGEALLSGAALGLFGNLNESLNTLPTLGQPNGPQNMQEVLQQIIKLLEGLLAKQPGAPKPPAGEVITPPPGKPPMATTLAVGEEGGGHIGGVDQQPATTRSIGEEAAGGPPNLTTMAVGEEGGGVRPPPWFPRPPFFPRDAGAAGAVSELLKNNTKPGSISGQEMTEAIIKGTQDLDNQAAGKEFAEFQRLAQQHPELLSPEAKKAYAVYEQHARAAQARGQTGIPMGEYMGMQLQMRAVSGPVFQDASAAAQLNGLAKNNKTPGSISGKEMVDALIQGTADLDNQAAGKEYADIAKFVRENEQLLSPDAKQAFAIYQKHAQAAQAKGQTGIDLRDFARMQDELKGVGVTAYQDRGAAATLTQLAKDNPKAGSISGNEMTDAIINATRDPDNQAAGKEYADLQKFVREHGAQMSPEAKRAFAVYDKHAKAAQAQGQTGIATQDFMRMQAEMRQVSSPQYQDVSAGQQLRALAKGNTKPGSISGQELTDAIIKGTRDLDGQAAGREFADVAKFVRENQQLLSPEAKRAYAVYEQTAKAAQAKGQQGIDLATFNRMEGQMRQVGQPNYQDKTVAVALGNLAHTNKTPGSISGQEMTNAILRGTADFDSQAAGKEFADIQKFARENEQLLSPQAKKSLAIYEKYAKAAQAKGQTGIPLSEYNKMAREMQLASIFRK